MQLTNDKKIYFLSDFHLGTDNQFTSLEREKKIIRFLLSIQEKAQAIYIIGDMFDFWYEYKTVVPRGFTRILGTLSQLADKGIELYFFVGNHDMWMKNYLETEIGFKQVYYEPQAIEINNKTFLIGHGDGVGPGDKGYKFLKKIFRNPLCKWLFGWIHPNIAIGIANYFSNKSKQKAGDTGNVFLGENEEWILMYCKEILQQKHYNYFIFGHRHLPIFHPLKNDSVYINSGDWLTHFSYIEFDGSLATLKFFEKEK